MKNKIIQLTFFVFSALFYFNSTIACAQPESKEFISGVKKTALECRAEITNTLMQIVSDGKLKKGVLFDTFYIPIPGTSPQKYHTQYDKLTDKYLRPVLDKYLNKNDSFLFVIAVDVNGYVPTHNSKYSHVPTGISSYDMNWNRTKRLFNDQTGINAAKNTKDELLQKYNRDTGELIYDYSLPIYIGKKHWGALRIGFKMPES